MEKFCMKRSLLSPGNQGWVPEREKRKRTASREQYDNDYWDNDNDYEEKFISVF